ncbi:MAG: alpha/beta hydrolase [Burkholderiales bacterium]|nr:alpha/beta hydrolase [Anaerolineae bacterium]
MSYPLYEFGGEGPPLHMALANGFPPQTYAPLLQPMTAHYRVVSLLPRPLWPNPRPESASSWRVFADDLVNGLRQHNLSDVVGLGHSLGAVTSMLAVLQAPERFRALILLDPVFFAPFRLRLVWLFRTFGLREHLPLVQGARKRRRDFASVDDAFVYFRGKPLFADWPDDTLRLYAQWNLKEANGGLTLAWSPEWEAHIYRTIFTDTWDELPKLRGKLPVLLIRAENSRPLTLDAVARTRRMLPDMTYGEIAGHGHLFPQTAPDETRRIINEWLARL